MNVVLTIAALMLTGPLGDGNEQSAATYCVAPCLVLLIEEAHVPARQSGMLVELTVSEGDEVREGDPLAHIDDTEAQMQFHLAEIEEKDALKRSESEIQEEYARAASAVADQEYAIYETLIMTGGVSPQELERYRLKKVEAELNIDVVGMERELAGYQLEAKQAAVEAAQMLIDRCIVESPFDGVVVQVMRHRGEWVQPGEPVLRVVNMQRLKVEGFVESEDLLPQDVLGKTADIVVRLGHGQVEELQGTITFVSPLVQAGGIYRISVEVENRRQDGFWILRPGLTAAMTIQLHE